MNEGTSEWKDEDNNNNNDTNKDFLSTTKHYSTYIICINSFKPPTSLQTVPKVFTFQ